MRSRLLLLALLSLLALVGGPTGAGAAPDEAQAPIHPTAAPQNATGAATDTPEDDPAETSDGEATPPAPEDAEEPSDDRPAAPTVVTPPPPPPGPPGRPGIAAPLPIPGSRGGPPRPPSPFAPGGSEEAGRPSPPVEAPGPAGPRPDPGVAAAPVASSPGGLPDLAALRVTRERPLFVPGRRGEAAARPVLLAPPREDKEEPTEIPPPPLTLVLSGLVSGPDVQLAILVDPLSSSVARMKAGEERDGWKLVEIGRISATFRRGEEETVLRLKPPGSTTTSPTPPRNPRPPGRPAVRQGGDDATEE